MLGELVNHTQKTENQDSTIANASPMPGMMIRAWGLRYFGSLMRLFPNTAEQLYENGCQADNLNPPQFDQSTWQ